MATKTAASMDQHEDHEQLVAGITDQFQGLYDSSAQAMYIYLDDENKSCNAAFAKLLGYKSPKDWAKTTLPFPEVFADAGSQHTLVSAYRHAMDSGIASSVPITWKTKTGKPVATNVILVPVDFQGHRFAVHWVEKE